MLTLQQSNEAFRLQKEMEDQGFSPEFPRIFARCLPHNENEATDQIDWNAVVAFESWCLIHPNLAGALDFLNKILHPRRFERETITSQIRTEVEAVGLRKLYGQ